MYQILSDPLLQKLQRTYLYNYPFTYTIMSLLVPSKLSMLAVEAQVLSTQGNSMLRDFDVVLSAVIFTI